MLTSYQAIYDFGFDKDFLKKDRQLGQNVFIDDVNIYDEYDADLISMKPISPQVNRNIYKSLGRHTYKINTFRFGESGLELKFYIGGYTHQDAQNNVNQLLRLFINRSVMLQTDESDYEYICVLESYDYEYTNVDFYYILTMNVNAIKRLPLIKYDLDSSFFTDSASVQYSFENIGIIESGIDIIVRSSGDDRFTIRCSREKDDATNSITFTSLSTSNYFYKIGGLDGLIYRSNSIDFVTNTNVFLNTDLVNFPVVKPGTNNITFVQNSVGQIKQARIQFYQTFLI